MPEYQMWHTSPIEIAAAQIAEARDVGPGLFFTVGYMSPFEVNLS